MSGHSKWATTKHKKAVVDAKRSKLFAKLIKNIEVAARTGGNDPTGNPTLYDAIQKAKKSSVPNDNIDRAIKRGSGLEAGAAAYETITYEGYGPHGVALIVEVEGLDDVLVEHRQDLLHVPRPHGIEQLLVAPGYLI
jgi:YebC/PmpR family DNA-binding regulatory protein